MNFFKTCCKWVGVRFVKLLCLIENFDLRTLTVCFLDSILPKAAFITTFDEVAVVGTVKPFGGGNLLPSLDVPVSWWSSLLSTDIVDNDSPLSEFEKPSLKQDTNWTTCKSASNALTHFLAPSV